MKQTRRFLKAKGVDRNRTDDEAFAEPCLTTWLPRRKLKRRLEFIAADFASLFFAIFENYEARAVGGIV